MVTKPIKILDSIPISFYFTFIFVLCCIQFSLFYNKINRIIWKKKSNIEDSTASITALILLEDQSLRDKLCLFHLPLLEVFPSISYSSNSVTFISASPAVCFEKWSSSSTLSPSSSLSISCSRVRREEKISISLLELISTTSFADCKIR